MVVELVDAVVVLLVDVELVDDVEVEEEEEEEDEDSVLELEDVEDVEVEDELDDDSVFELEDVEVELDDDDAVFELDDVEVDVDDEDSVFELDDSVLLEDEFVDFEDGELIDRELRVLSELDDVLLLLFVLSELELIESAMSNS